MNSQANGQVNRANSLPNAHIRKPLEAGKLGGFSVRSDSIRPQMGGVEYLKVSCVSKRPQEDEQEGLGKGRS